MDVRLKNFYERTCQRSDMKDKEYTCVVKLEFSCNNFEAKSKKEYIEKVKNSFKEDFNIHLTNKEITEIEVKE